MPNISDIPPFDRPGARADAIKDLLERAGDLVSQASDLFKATDEHGQVQIAPKGQVFDAIADLIRAEARLFHGTGDAR